MRIDILTLFPDAVDAMMHASILGRAQERLYHHQDPPDPKLHHE